MTRGRTLTTMRIGRGRVRANDPRSGADLRRRLKAAGLDGDADPGDMPIDDFRIALARRIAMMLNRWDGCREPLCRRNRGCMAPQGACSNIPRGPRDPVAEARVMAQVQRMLARDAERRADAGET